MDKTLNEMVEHWEIIWYVITGLIAILVAIAGFGLREQVMANKQNSKEHTDIQVRLASGSGEMKRMGEDISDNEGDIKLLDIRVDEHSKKFVKVEGDIKTIYKKIE